MTATRKFKSDAFEAIHRAAAGMERAGRHCQSKFYTARWPSGAGRTSTVFAHVSLPSAARVDAENDLYAFVPTMPDRALVEQPR
jgi:hypothetical protein